MQGSQVLTKYKDVADEEWMQIPFIRELSAIPQFVTVCNVHRSLLKMTCAQFAAEIFLGVLSSKKKSLDVSLEHFVNYSIKSCIDASINWERSAQGYFYWSMIYGEL